MGGVRGKLQGFRPGAPGLHLCQAETMAKIQKLAVAGIIIQLK